MVLRSIFFRLQRPQWDQTLIHNTFGYIVFDEELLLVRISLAHWWLAAFTKRNMGTKAVVADGLLMPRTKRTYKILSDEERQNLVSELMTKTHGRR